MDDPTGNAQARIHDASQVKTLDFFFCPSETRDKVEFGWRRRI